MSSNRGVSRGYRVAGLVVCLLAVMAITAAITRSLVGSREPTFASFGTAVVDTPVSLHRQPSEDTETAGKLEAGEPVEILEYVPQKTLDAWVLIRPKQNVKLYGYAPLRSLDHLETKNEELDLWHAMQLLAQASPADLKDRLTSIGEMLKTAPPSEEKDRSYQTLASESVRLANDRIDNADEARTLVTSAETYLDRIAPDSPVVPETEEVRAAIQKVRITLGDIPDPTAEVKAPVAPSPQGEISRLLKEATAAFDNGRYARAATLSQQAVAKGQGKRDLTKLVDQARALQKKAETAQEEYEKVNIQSR